MVEFTREEIFEMHQEICGRALELMKKKNADYSKDGPLDNFFVCEALRLGSAENGVLIRMSDKLSRLGSVFAKGAQVVDERTEDTIVDIINYAILLLGIRRMRGTDRTRNEEDYDPFGIIKLDGLGS